MEFTENKLTGSYTVRFKKIEDERGYFSRAWCADEFRHHGLTSKMLQLNTGFSHRSGTLRGMHYQIEPHAEAKFVRCTRGAIFDVIIDLRPDSSTFKQWYGLELNEDNGLMLYAPEGFAHGYQTLRNNTEMYYLTSEAYAPAAARGVRYNDPAFGIKWPLPVAAVSEADSKWPDFPQ